MINEIKLNKHLRVHTEPASQISTCQKNFPFLQMLIFCNNAHRTLLENLKLKEKL